MKKKILYSILILLLVILGIAAFVKKEEISSFLFNTTNPAQSGIVIEDAPTMEDMLTATYIAETTYDGSVSLSKELFERPFQKTSKYSPNKDYIKNISTVAQEEIIRIAKEYSSTLFNIGYRDIKENTDTFKENLLRNIVVENTELSKDKYLENTAEWYVTNKVSMESTFNTDKCLIYKDAYTYIRGELVIKVFSCKDLTSLEKKLKLKDVELGREYRLICDIGLIKTADTYKITSYEVVE